MAAPPTSELLLDTGLLRAGRFRVAVEDPRFELAGQVRGPEFVFPRRGVWIEHSSQPAFIADPTVVTFYNGSEPYRRLPISADGDRSDWYALAPEALREVLATFDPGAQDRRDPFPFSHLQVDQESLLLERAVADHAAGGAPDPLFVEEAMLGVLCRVLRRGDSSRPSPRRGGERGRGRAAIELVRCSVLRNIGRRWTLSELGAAAGLSPFQLCRAFRRSTARTVHNWIVDLRLRESLERLLDGGDDLARLALDLGFSSHSHFTTAFRSAFQMTPSAFRSRPARELWLGSGRRATVRSTRSGNPRSRTCGET